MARSISSFQSGVGDSRSKPPRYISALDLLEAKGFSRIAPVKSGANEDSPEDSLGDTEKKQRPEKYRWHEDY